MNNEIGSDGVYKIDYNPFDNTKNETPQQRADRITASDETKEAMQHGFGNVDAYKKWKSEQGNLKQAA
ncbi:MAG: hypothetical protein ACD_58C00276G0003 [uncultured bacterium]|nr:MAG: hypothetical protein ACD_58C00276G0003 [uncultured bacterium]